MLVAAGPSFAQVNTVNLSGTVLDPQGLAIAGAKVSVKSLTTGAIRNVESGGDGHYQIIGLPPGDYELTVEAKGLARLVQPSLHLTLGAAAEFNPQMSLEKGQQTVTVTGET
ncbi:MAG: carboxypeptidase-like regulatory domain-containing protein [Limisphaerales bacterium]